jgi:hypothetical protein
MSVPLSILTALAPGFPAPEAVLNQRVQINVAQWELVEGRTGNPEVAWALGVLPNPIIQFPPLRRTSGRAPPRFPPRCVKARNLAARIEQLLTAGGDRADRGGTDEQFVAARKRYERALAMTVRLA